MKIKELKAARKLFAENKKKENVWQHCADNLDVCAVGAVIAACEGIDRSSNKFQSVIYSNISTNIGRSNRELLNETCQFLFGNQCNIDYLASEYPNETLQVFDYLIAKAKMKKIQNKAKEIKA